MRWRIPTLVLVTWLAATGCTSGEPTARPTTTSAPATTAAPAPAPAEAPSVEAARGCGPADAAEVRVTGRSVGTGEVVIEVAYDDTVYDRSGPMTGPTVGQVFETRLPHEAYEAGSADVRIVRADDRGDFIASGAVRLDEGPSCG